MNTETKEKFSIACIGTVALPVVSFFAGLLFDLTTHTGYFLVGVLWGLFIGSLLGLVCSAVSVFRNEKWRFLAAIFGVGELLYVSFFVFSLIKNWKRL